MTRAPSDRSHLSIGEVLSLLQDEFPDVTISKIRFLESQGLLDPERTPSGYRKFYEADIERLRWILRQQKEHYLPLKVIKDRLDDLSLQPSEPDPGGAAGPAEPGEWGDAGQRPGRSDRAVTGERPVVAPPGPADRREPTAGSAEGWPPASLPGTGPSRSSATNGRAALVVDGRAQGAPAAPGSPAPGAGAANGTAHGGGRGSVGSPPAGEPPVVRAPERQPGAGGAGSSPGAVSLTIDELADASGMSVSDLHELKRYGLLSGHEVGDATYYDGDALVVARTAAGFLQHGIEARHLRSYKVAVDREAGLFEQIVLPLLKQRNPEAHRRATRTVAELIHLGEVMRNVLLRHELRGHVEP